MLLDPQSVWKREDAISSSTRAAWSLSMKFPSIRPTPPMPPPNTGLPASVYPSIQRPLLFCQYRSAAADCARLLSCSASADSSLCPVTFASSENAREAETQLIERLSSSVSRSCSFPPSLSEGIRGRPSLLDNIERQNL